MGSEEKETIGKSIAKMENELEHVNKHLAGIDLSINELRQIISRQSKLQEDVSRALQEHVDIRRDIDGLGTRVSNNTENIDTLHKMIEDLPKNAKVNIFDYLFKCMLAAFGGYIVLKISGLLAGLETLLAHNGG